mmetsp:Transcript_10399/g.25994  ORF Transcript_10399/g.25994 Transcript_10399/m.25994 type:complete len:149 (+) Transcript_10399:176-622(+)
MAEAFGGNTRVVVARELTKVYEEFWVGTAEEAAREFSRRQPRGEFTVLLEHLPPHSSASDAAAAVDSKTSSSADLAATASAAASSSSSSLTEEGREILGALVSGGMPSSQAARLLFGFHQGQRPLSKKEVYNAAIQAKQGQGQQAEQE